METMSSSKLEVSLWILNKYDGLRLAFITLVNLRIVGRTVPITRAFREVKLVAKTKMS